MEVGLRGLFGTIDARSHFDNVEVNFHDALFRPESLDEEGEVGLHAFAHPRTFRPAEYVLGCLLRDGAAATVTTAAFALFHDCVEGDYVEATVPEEVVVLRSDGSAIHVGRNFLDGYPFLVDTVAFMDGLHALECGDGWVYPTIEYGK